MRKILCLALGGLLASATWTVVLAAPQKIRVHGTIEAVSGQQFAVQAYNGATVAMQLGTMTKYISVIAARLEDIKPGDFVGIGATGPESRIVALEVVIFPPSMRGTGEGHYPWSVPAAVADADRHLSVSPPSGAPPVQGTMTNGTVAAAAPEVTGTMTNGTVAASKSATGGKEFTVTYGHGGSVRILVPADVPVVRLARAGRSVLLPGGKTFAVGIERTAGAAPVAAFIAVGKDGLMPPM